MTAVPVPVIVVGVPVIAEFDLGRTSRGVVDVVVRESDLVILTISKTISPVSIYTRFRLLNHLHGPVVMAIAR